MPAEIFSGAGLCIAPHVFGERMIYGIGIDAVDVARFKAALEKWGERLEARLFTEGERAYARTKKYPERHLAARFAAKVSLHKAVGNFIPYKDIEVKRDLNGSTEFLVKGFDSKAMELNVTISHDGELAIAETIAEKIDK